MLLGFKTELKLNKQQRTELLRHAGVARHAYNWGNGLCQGILAHNQANPGNKIKFPSAIDLHKWLVALVKTENPWYYEVSKSAPQYALRSLRTAWERCLMKVSGSPKFKKKGHSDAFTLSGGGLRGLGTRKIQVPKIGVLKTYEELPQVTPKSVTMTRQADRWFISFKIEIEPTQTPKTVDVVGVDLGVKSLATLSTGEIFEGLSSYRQMSTKLSGRQWLNRHKQKGSANWNKAQVKIARLHRRIANIRKDVLHQLTTYLAKNHGTVVIEDLNVSGMMANRKLARAVQNMGFSEFRRQLEYKCQLYGSQLTVVDRFYPSSKICSNCKNKKESLSLSDRVYQCAQCGFECDRDLNAAINLAEAVRSTVLASGLVGCRHPQVEGGRNVSNC